MTLVDKLTQAEENGKYVKDMFSEFPKAFDTVNHEMQLNKLYHYDVRWCAQSGLTVTYLTDRQQSLT